jgi:hypothetical protein
MSKLKIVDGAPSPKIEPPGELGPAGRALWNRVTSAYRFDDVGGTAMLYECCAARDRVERLRAQIDADGELLVIKGARKAHPLLPAEIAGRAFITRTLTKLGLGIEPVLPPGRPPGPGVSGLW